VKIVGSLVLFYLISASNSLAQSPKTDSALYTALQFYHQYAFPEPGLYNGRQYAEYASTLQAGHPYFLSPEMNKGSLVYDGILYENISIQYDIVKEQLVIKYPFQTFSLQLTNEKVNWFTVLNHTFIRLVEDSANRPLIQTGFYDRLYNGHVILLEKQNKFIQEELNAISGIKRSITETSSFYLKKDNKYYPVNSRGSLLDVLKDRKKEIQQFIRKNKTDIRGDKENAILSIVTYYDKLSG